MWCNKCNIDTNDKICPICGSTTVEDLPVEVYWCSECKVPVIQTSTQADKGICPICKRKTKYLASDLRPVFPEERLLVEILLKRKPNEFLKNSVWANNNRYYVDGEPIPISNDLYCNTDIDTILNLLQQNEKQNSYEYFDKHIKLFIAANLSLIHI